MNATSSPTASSRQDRWQLYLCCLLLVACTIPWRRGTYFSGALDPVVAAKGAIGGAGLVLAFLLARRSPTPTPLGARTLVIAALYLVVSCLGGWAAGQALPSVIVAVRVAMLLASLALLLQGFGISRLTTALVQVMGAVAAFAVATGAGTLTSGRLRGGLPPLAPNEVAFLCGALLLLTLQRMMQGQARRWEPALALVLFGAVWLTGSRTTAATLVLAAAVMVVQARTFSVPAFVTMVAVVPIAGFATLATNAVTSLLLRGGDENVTTLSSRTIAWNAALTMDTSTWQRWFGGGLPLKHIPVSGQYWQTQLLDSSWISALVQTGIVGLLLAALWSVVTLASACRAPRPWRPLWLGFVVFVTLRSFLESGLFDASTSFITFAVVSLMVEPVTRGSLDPGSVDAHTVGPDTENSSAGSSGRRLHTPGAGGGTAARPHRTRLSSTTSTSRR